MSWPIASLIIAIALLFLALWLDSHFRLKAARKQIDLLCTSITAFLSKPEKSQYSLEDGELSQLQNCVAALEDAYLQLARLLDEERQRNHRFVADISHQLKTPLAGLKLYVELTEGEHLQKELFLIERMEKLIQQLIRMEKLRVGAYEFHYQPIEARRLVRDIWQELSVLYPKHNLEVKGDAELRGDQAWLKEALQNIIKNSCEQPPGQTPIQVTLDRSETMIMIDIVDSGGGVRGIEAEQLFERFNRLAPEDSMQNSGLGLAITKMIIERHHGSIVARNTPHGLKVSIDLPVHEGYRSY